MSEKNIENKKGSKLKTILIIVLLVIVVSGGAFGAYMIFSKKKADTPANAVPPANSQQAVNGQGNVTVNMNNQVMPATSVFTYDMGEFLLNLSDEDGRRFLKAKVFLGYENKKLLKELEANAPAIKDSINSVIRAKKAKDFSTKGLENIKLEILNRINPMFKNGRCDSVYFPEILVQ